MVFSAPVVLFVLSVFWVIFINENIWYVASMGHGVGIMIVCTQMLKQMSR